MSLADLSVGSGTGVGSGVGMGYNSATTSTSNTGQHQDYIATQGNSMASGHNSASQLGDFMGGGDSLNWPSSNSSG